MIPKRFWQHLQICSISSKFCGATFFGLNGAEFVYTNFYDISMVGEFFFDNKFFACKINRLKADPSSTLGLSKFYGCAFTPFPQLFYIKTEFSGFFNMGASIDFLNDSSQPSPKAVEEVKKYLLASPDARNKITPYSEEVQEELKELNTKLEGEMTLNI